MSTNAYYNYSGAFLPGAQARAEQVATEFSAVQAGFSGLSYQGTDSGTANAYVVTTTGNPTGSYKDGNVVEFAAGFANTGASTIVINSIGTANLITGNGAALASGAIGQGYWYRAVYSATATAWCIVAPSPFVSTGTAVVSGAAPTNKVSLTAAGGVSSSVLPVDATFAIDQSIAPTWTSQHFFSHGVVVLGANGGVAATISAVGTGGGAFISGGTGTLGYALKVTDLSQGVNLIAMYGDGHGGLGGTGGTSLTFSTAGTATFTNGVVLAGYGAGTAALVANSSGTTGTCTASLSATNKPGSTTRTTPAVWLPVVLDGTTYDIPCYARG